MKITKTVILEMTQKEFDALDAARDYMLEIYPVIPPHERGEIQDIVDVLDEMTWHTI